MPKRKNRKLGGGPNDERLKKRKHEDLEETDGPPNKKAQDNPSSRPLQDDYDLSIGLKDPTLLADFFAQTVQRHCGDSSSLELADKTLSSRAFLDTADFSQPHVVTQLPTFLETYIEGGKEKLSTCEGKGTPHTLVIASSGIRTADLVRELRVYNVDQSKVAKLFAKHMKLKDNIDYVQSTNIGIAVGTPSRLKDLIEADALKVTGLKRIVVDGSYQDGKKRTIFDMSEIFKPMLDLLNKVDIKLRYTVEDDKIEIMVF